MKKKIVGMFFIVVIVLTVIFYFFYEKNKQDKPITVSEKNQVNKSNISDDSKIVEFAKTYILKKPQLYLNREKKVDWDSSELGTLFVNISPEWVVSQKTAFEYILPNTYNSPYDYLNDKYIVSWFFIPGCEEDVENIDQPNWFNKEGIHCLGGYDLRVIINSDKTVSLVELNSID